MKLPKSFTIVTPLSKTIALFLFILLPFAGFYAGYKYRAGTYIANPIVQNNSVSIPTSTTGPTADWKIFKSSNGISFRYPSTWALEDRKDSYSRAYAIITSKNGFLMEFVVDNYARGGGCGEEDKLLTQVNVFSIEPTETKTQDIIKWSLTGGPLEQYGTNYVRKEIMLGFVVNGFPKLGTNGKECLTSEETPGGQFGLSRGSYPDSSPQQQLGVNDYFNLPDLKTAETILKSYRVQ